MVIRRTVELYSFNQRKMKFNFSFGFLLVTFIAGFEVSADKRCGPGGVFNSCDSPCRQLATCANPEPGFGGRICPDVCEPRCVCTTGYVYHHGRCISRAHC